MIHTGRKILSEKESLKYLIIIIDFFLIPDFPCSKKESKERITKTRSNTNNDTFISRFPRKNDGLTTQFLHQKYTTS